MTTVSYAESAKMIPIQELLNKIKWDPREKPEQYSLVYLDLGRLVEIPYKEVTIEGADMIIKKEGKRVEIPLHRIRQVKKAGVVVWSRE